MKRYTAKSGATQYKPAYHAIHQIMAGENSTGFCLACGKRQHGVEPDARRYECNACHKPKVYGAEQLLIMGLFHN